MARPDSLGVLLRVEDEARPDFWAELRLSEGDLARLLEEVRQMQKEEDR